MTGPSRLAPPASGAPKVVADPLPGRRWNHSACTQSAGSAVAGGDAAGGRWVTLEEGMSSMQLNRQRRNNGPMGYGR
ncbi:hypothetical protein ACQJBY_035992 [Aegilops geniculata]